MTLFFSPSITGFFDDAIHERIPEDAVEITAERHRELMASQMDGLVICAGSDGKPEARAPIHSPEEVMAAIRSRRDSLLNGSDWTQMPDSPLSAPSQEAWRLYRQALRDLPESVDDLASIDWPIPPTA